jgi:Zn-dependent peptidase ImmA (M78 family)
MSLRRGFKTEAATLAEEVRSECDLGLLDRLDPWKLARHLDIPIWPLSTLDTELALTAFLEDNPSAFSAVTVFSGTRRVIVHNDAHSAGRQASNVAHELAHGLLLHVPGQALASGGIREWNSVAEEEAQYLGAALLITEDAAMEIVQTGQTLDEAAVRYGVSKPMVQYRVNVTGARLRIARARGR